MPSTDIYVETWALAVAHEGSKRMVWRCRCLCFLRSLLEKLLLFSISSRSFDSRPPVALVYETNLRERKKNRRFFTHKWTKLTWLTATAFFFPHSKEAWSSEIRTLDLRVSSRLLTPKTTVSWLGPNISMVGRSWTSRRCSSPCALPFPRILEG